jgi:unsaturated rhamnogalacturonyl hydrolase
MKLYSQEMARSVMKNLTGDKMRWHYEYALVLQSIFLLGLKTGNDEFCDFVKKMYDVLITSKGEILTYRENEYNLDQINPGKNLFLLHKKYGEPQYLIAIEKLREQLRNHPRTKTNGFWHKQIYPWQMWLDGLYMQAPFYARYVLENKNEADPKDILFEDIVHQFTLIEEKARDTQTGLLYHAWDESKQQKWANPDTGCSPHFWGRAIGWYCMALVDTIEIIKPVKSCLKLEAISQRLLNPLLKYQDSHSGLWYQIVDKGNEEKNYLESSASSMYVYFLLKMLSLNLVPENQIADVKTAACKAYMGLIEHKTEYTEELHLNGICKVAGLGGTPYRDGSFEYYVSEPIAADDYKGVGPFILASMEFEEFKNPDVRLSG